MARLTRTLSTPSTSYSAQSSGDRQIETNSITSGAIGRKWRYVPTTVLIDRSNQFAWTQVALDYNAPFLTLAAYSVLNSTDRPFFTSLGPGAYESVKPSGTPCDAVFSCRAGRHLSEGGKIAMAVAITVVGLIIIGLILCISCYGRGSGRLSVFSLRKSGVQY